MLHMVSWLHKLINYIGKHMTMMTLDDYMEDAEKVSFINDIYAGRMTEWVIYDAKACYHTSLLDRARDEKDKESYRAAYDNMNDALNKLWKIAKFMPRSEIDNAQKQLYAMRSQRAADRLNEWRKRNGK
jgi:hypothetical protein